MSCATCQSELDASGGCPRCAALPTTLDGAPDAMVGREVSGRFVVEAAIGAGELGVVYRARDAHTGQPVALKCLHPDVAVTHGDALLRAAAQLADVRYPRLVRVRAASRDEDGATCLVLEFVEGETLADLLGREGPLAPVRAAELLFQLCNAVAPLHRLERPHGNLKPTNVFITERDDGPFLRVADPGPPALFRAHRHGGEVTWLGTPKYFSPEQAVGRRPTPASDVFTIGVMGYQMLTGSLPFQGATPELWLDAIAHRDAPPVAGRARTRLPEALAAIVDRCLDGNLARRPPTVHALAAELAAFIKQARQQALDATPRDRTYAGPAVIVRRTSLHEVPTPALDAPPATLVAVRPPEADPATGGQRGARALSFTTSLNVADVRAALLAAQGPAKIRTVVPERDPSRPLISIQSTPVRQPVPTPPPKAPPPPPPAPIRNRQVFALVAGLFVVFGGGTWLLLTLSF